MINNKKRKAENGATSDFQAILKNITAEALLESVPKETLRRMLEIMQHKKEKKEVKKHLNAEALEPLETLPPQILMALKTLVMMQLRRVDRQNVGCQSPGNKVSVPVEDKKMVGFLECFRELDGWREIHRTRKLSFFPFTEKVEYHKFVCSDREKLLSFLKSFKIEEDEEFGELLVWRDTCQWTQLQPSFPPF